MAEPQLQSVVQRMIDAGEDESNIATVIQHFKAQTPEAPKDQGFMQGVLNTIPTPSKVMGMITSIPENIRQRFAPGSDSVFPNQDTTNTPLGKVMGGRPYEGAGELFGTIGQAAIGEAVPRIVSARMRPATSPPHLDLTNNVKAGALNQEQLFERVQAAQQAREAGTMPQRPAQPTRFQERPQAGSVEAPAPTPAPEAAPTPTPKGKSPQQLLNEEAIARRRAAYQAKQQAAPAPELSPAEQFNQRYGLKQPTPDEIRFPKGQRGAPRSSEAGRIPVSLLMNMMGASGRAVAYPMAYHYGGGLGLGALAAGDAGRLIAAHPEMSAQAARAALLAGLATNHDEQ